MPNYKVKKETDINIKKAAISANLNIDKTKILTNSSFTIQGKVNTLSREGKIYYRTWAEKNRAVFKGFGEQKWRTTDEVNSTKEKWEEYILSNNSFSISNQTTDKDNNYKYYIQFKDEFGNESEVTEYRIKVIPPIIVNKAKIDMPFKGNSLCGRFYLTINAESTDNSAKLTHAVVYLKRKTYSVERFGKHHSATIRSNYTNITEDGWNLYNSLQIERKGVISDPGASIVIEWNIEDKNPENFKSIKRELIEKFRDDYFEMRVYNDKGQSVSQKVPIEELGCLD